MMRVKRFVALLVVIATVASLCTFSMAVNAEELIEVEVTEADLLLIEKLEALGVISNDYDATGYVTRREMAEIVAKYANLPVSGITTTESPFHDVSETDSAYSSIYALYNMGVITGDDQMNFHPDNYVSYDEALVFVINAIGYKPLVAREGGFPTGYHRIAIKHRMLKNLSAGPGTSAMSVLDVYRLLDAALTTATVEYVYYGDGQVAYTFSDTETFLSATYGIRKYRDQLTGNEYTYLTDPDSNMTDEQIAIGRDRKIYDTPGYIYGYFLGYSVDYYMKDSDGYGYEMVYIEETPGINSIFHIDAEDLLHLKTTGSKIFYEDENQKEKNIVLSGYLDVIYNNKCYTDYVNLRDVLPTTGYIEALDNNNDGEYEVLFVYDYRSVVVDIVDKYNERIVTDAADPLDVETIDLDSSKHKVVMSRTEGGEKVNINQLKNGDVLSILESRGTERAITVYVSNKIVSGKISGYDGQLGYLIGTEYYEAVEDYVGTPLTLGLSGDFYLDINNEIVKYEYVETDDSSKLAVIAAIRYEESTFLTEIEVRLFNQDGDFIEAPLSEKIRIDGAKYDLTKPEDAAAVLETLSNDASAPYEVTSTYILKYTISDDYIITSIDKDSEGPGRLSLLTNDGKAMCARTGNMLHLASVTTPTIYAWFNKSEGVIFSTPEDGDLGNLDNYAIYKDFKTEIEYTNDPDASGIYVPSIAAYTYNKTGVTTIDAFIFRGLGGSAGKTTKLSVVDEVTTSLDMNDEERITIYTGDGEKHLLASDVVVKKFDSATHTVGDETVSWTLAELVPGVVFEGKTDAKGFINQIDIYAEYDAVESVVAPTIKYTDGYPEYMNTTTRGYGSDFVVVGTVDAVDVESKRLQYTSKVVNAALESHYEEASYPLALDNSEVVVYYTDTGKVAIIEFDELIPGDTFVSRLTTYGFGAKQIVVFR